MAYIHTCKLVLYVFARMHVCACMCACHYAMLYRKTRICKDVTRQKNTTRQTSAKRMRSIQAMIYMLVHA